MSLIRIALRIAAVEALKGNTLVGANVLDTPNGALDIQADGSLRTEEEKPFVSVFTDKGKAQGITGRSLVENGQCDIVFEIGVSAAMLETDKQTGVTTMIGVAVPASDRTFEFFLDVVQRQIGDVLNDPHNAWAEIYRGLHDRVIGVEYAGARNSDDGQKLAGHQMRLTVDLVDDPLSGEPLVPESAFAQFLSAMEASDDGVYQAQAETMRAVLAGQNQEWETLQRLHGMTAAELNALGRGPLITGDTTAAAFVAADIESAGSIPVEVGDD